MRQDTPRVAVHTRLLETDIFASLSRDELLAVLSVMHRILDATRKRDLERLVTELPSLFPRRSEARNGRPDLRGKQNVFDASSNDERTYYVLHYVFSCLTKAQARMDAPKAGQFRVHDHACPLSPRELTVLRWMKEGKTNWEIARILGLSERTVRFHVGGIFEKLDVTSRTQAVARALVAGLIAS